jgi:hypothetical protein
MLLSGEVRKDEKILGGIIAIIKTYLFPLGRRLVRA